MAGGILTRQREVIGVPSDRAIRENAQSLARYVPIWCLPGHVQDMSGTCAYNRYASICQEHGLVPIVEPAR